MESISANEAKTHFGELLLKSQQSPVQINKNGKPVAVVISMDEYANFEALKINLLKQRANAAKIAIKTKVTRVNKCNGPYRY